MSIKIIINLVLIVFLCISCSKEKINKSVINEKSLDLQVLEVYKEGKNSRSWRCFVCAKKFTEVEILSIIHGHLNLL